MSSPLVIKFCRSSLGILSLVLMLLQLSGPVQSFAAEDLDADTIRQMTRGQIMAALDTYREILSLPNDSHYQEDIDRLITWLDGAFSARGFTVEVLDTGGSPLILAERASPGADKTALIYLQADGQPVDPALWHQEDPYTAVLKEVDVDGAWQIIPWSRLDDGLDPDWRIFARSAVDSKGPITQFLHAIDAIDKAGLVTGYNLKLTIDTEEELGSPFLPEAVIKNRDRLAADMLLIFDGPPHASNQPSLQFGARGIVTITLVAHGPRVPQHSGHYGNYAPNPAFALSHMLGTMKSMDGRVLLPGFYDGVVIDEAALALLNAVPDDIEALHGHLGIAVPDAVAETLQLALQYPSLNIRGLGALKVGRESRTLIPDRAIGEIDIRLVKESDWEKLVGLVRQHIERLGYHVLDREPTEEERLTIPHLVTFTHDYSYGAFRTDFDSLPGVLARRAMVRLFGEDPIMIRTAGGSIPISPYVDALDVPAVAVPTVNIDNNQHAPNENIRLGNFIEGISIAISVLTEKP